MDEQNKLDHKIRDIIVFFTYNTKYLTEIRLNKLIYLAELYSIEKLGKRLLDIDFLSYRYGPYSPDIATIGEAISGEDITIEYETTNTGHNANFYRTTKDKMCVKHLTVEEFGVLDDIVRDFKFKSTSQIVDAAKNSEPYLKTSFEDVIDLDKYKRDMDAIYRNNELIDSVKQSMAEYSNGEGVLINSEEELHSYFDSL
ncbi:MAG: SocA family protein [Methanosarcinales archaeon]|nr:SocA family protein [Methanosarcinales archaeon]